MIENVGVRALAGVAAGALAYWVLLKLMFLGGGATTLEVVVIAVIAVVVALGVFLYLGRRRRASHS